MMHQHYAGRHEACESVVSARVLFASEVAYIRLSRPAMRDHLLALAPSFPDVGLLQCFDAWAPGSLGHVSGTGLSSRIAL
eukprot:9433034-Pyramimonas_sp.AAC.1